MRGLIGLVLGILFVFSAALPAHSQEFGYLGRATISYNDLYGDGDDRWQTGGGTFSVFFGPKGLDGLPAQFGELIEIRARAQVISPDNYTAPAGWDRRAAGVITGTLNTHFESRGLEVSGGVGVAVTGPQTQLIRFQNMLHGLTPANDPNVPDAVLAAQIGDAVYPTVQAEVARRIRLDESITLRPFVETQAGVESFARIGGDIFVGDGFDGGVLLRGATTGFVYQGVGGKPRPNVSLVFGADTARVFSSALLPSADGYRLTPLRHRVRGGAMIESEHLSIFAGASWLGREFEAQPEGQIVGVLKVKLRF